MLLTLLHCNADLSKDSELVKRGATDLVLPVGYLPQDIDQGYGSERGSPRLLRVVPLESRQ